MTAEIKKIRCTEFRNLSMVELEIADDDAVANRRQDKEEPRQIRFLGLQFLQVRDQPRSIDLPNRRADWGRDL